MRDIATHNQRAYGTALTVRHYGKSNELRIQEAVILERLGPEFKGKRILDIGVGGGRTTEHLIKISRDYTGIDYSQQMIEKCKVRYPSVSFVACDARDLSRFDAASFDFIMFSLNGIDSLGHADRLQALSEIRRVLAPGGVFVFSSHNHNSYIRRPWSLNHLPFDINPFRQPLHFLRKIALYPSGIFNHIVNRKHERKSNGYSILNVEDHDYSLLIYFIPLRHQISQLAEIGFENVKAVGMNGEWKDEKDYSMDHEDRWIYYLCRAKALLV